MQHTAKFWVLINDCPVKLSLRPGDSLSHVSGGATDEGYSWEAHTWAFNGVDVKSEVTTKASDCDGRFETSCNAYCPTHMLHAGCDFDGVRFPAWKLGKSSQRDYTAEAANY